jgi:hypothetical protein
LKDRHGNRVGPCQRAEAIAHYLHHEQWRPAPVPPTKNRCKLISSDLEMNADVFSNKEVIAAIKNERREGAMTRLILTQLKHWTRKIAIFWTLAFNEWWTSESIPALIVSIFKKRKYPGYRKL